MKFSLAAILVAFTCATTVCGAPSTPNVSFEELALADTLNIGENLSEWADKLKCIINVLDKELINGLEELWEKTRSALEQLADDWKKCSSASSPIEQFKCRADVLTKSANLLNNFLNELRKEIDPENLKEIHDKVINQCLKATSNFDSFDESEDAEEIEEFAVGSLPEQFSCIIDVLGDVSKSNGLSELWAKSQPQLQLHVDNWKACENIENKVANLLCNVKEGATTYRLINEYFRLVAAQKPIVVLEIVRQVQLKCNAYQNQFEELMRTDDAAEYGIITGTLEKLNCMVNAVTEALVDTEFAKPWEKMVKDIKNYMNSIKACKDQPTDWSEAKCVVNEAAKAYRVVYNFLRNVRKLNHELYDNIKSQIKTRCFK